MDETFSNVISNRQFWLFIEHKDEQLSLLRELLILVDIVELIHELSVFIVDL